MGKFRVEITDMAKKQKSKKAKFNNLVDAISAMGHYSNK
jgi:hypothetical protein